MHKIGANSTYTKNVHLKGTYGGTGETNFRYLREKCSYQSRENLLLGLNLSLAPFRKLKAYILHTKPE